MTLAERPSAAGESPPAATAPSLLSIRGLGVRFRDRRGRENVAVEDFSADVVPGRSLAIVGESGSGKSVSMRSLLHLLPATAHISGEAWFGGEELLGRQEHDMQPIRGRRIAMVFQNASQAFNPTLKLKRQLTEHLLWHHLCDRREAVERAVDALGRVGIPEPARSINLYPFQLSGGMLQRAMVALAIVAQPELLIADEPTTAVDVRLQRQVLDLLMSLKDEGLSMIMITHDLGVARYTCDDVIVMQSGHVVERGRMSTFIESASSDYSRRLLDAALDIAPRHRSDEPASDGTPVLSARDLTKVFEGPAGPITAVDDVEVTIGPGESVGVVGESGSGKSTLARLLLRLIEPTSGEILFSGVDLMSADREGMRNVRRSAQMIFQNPYGSLMPHRTVAENIAEPLRLHRIGSRRQRRSRALELLEQVGIPPTRADHYPRQFSGGQQQRIAIARALALEPRLLVCDEPTSALDVSIQAEILALLSTLRHELQLSMLFITHNLAVAQEVSDRIVVMARGRIVESAPTYELFTHPEHAYTKALLAAVLPIHGDALPSRQLEVLDLDGQLLVQVGPDHWALAPYQQPDDR